MHTRGDIFLVDLGEGVGSEQGGIRPCLILQNNRGNHSSTTTIIAPMTSKNKKFNLTHVDIDCLRYPTQVMLEQIRVIDKQRLIKFIVALDEKVMEEVEQKIFITLGLNIK